MPRFRFARLVGLALAVTPLSLLACEGRLHVEVQQTGVYALDHDAIVAQQPGLSDCTADQLMLTGHGREVPIRIVGDSGGRFGPGARIEWVGHQLHGPESWFDAFSVDNVYFLGASPGRHARMTDAVAGAGPRAPLERRLHLEQENLMIRLDPEQQRPGEESDVWQWAKLTQIDPKPFSTPIDLPDLAARGDVVLTLNFRGLSELLPPPMFKGVRPDDHTVVIALNGKPVATFAWNKRNEFRREIKLPASALKARGNTLTMSVPRRALPWDKSDAVDVVMFNWVEARYPITGDLGAGVLPFQTTADGAIELEYRGEGAPVLYGGDGTRRSGRALGGGRYAFAAAAAGTELFPALDGALAKPVALRSVVANDWQHPAHGYDYLIVAHPKLIDAIKPLAAFHEQRGLKVAVLDVNEVYDTFNDGIAHPQAIRNLVDRAYHDWPAPKPRFLLLVGDASFDIRHDTYNDANYAKWTNLELLYPNGFGTVPGTTYANPPKKLADRNLIPTWQFPSPEGQSASDNAFATVDGDDWHPVVAVGRFPVVEPDEVKGIVAKSIDYMSKPQLGAWRRDVMFITDEMEAFKNASNDIAKDLGKSGFVADKVYASASEANNVAHQNAIRQGIDDGRLIVHFIGHGGRYIWRTGPPDLRKNHDLFTLDDVGSLTNGERLPMVLSMTCYSAPFDNPTEDSIGEKFLREPGKGAIAVFAASWRNAPSAEYSRSVIDELLKPGATIGEAIMRAKKTSQNRTLVEMYNLLGDPAVVLERPRDEARVAFDKDRWNPGVDVDLGTSRFNGNLVVDWLDAKGAKLASTPYALDTPRFRLDVPSFAAGKAMGVRIYAASPTTGRDLVGGADVAIAKPLPPLSTRIAAWWRDFTRPPYKPHPRTPDTISQLGFDDSKVETAAASGTQAASGAR